LKTDSTPIHGDGYEPRSLKFRSRANAEALYSVRMGPSGGCKRYSGGKKISDGEISKTTTIGPLQFSYYAILLSKAPIQSNIDI
jgi:hypothetical protein